MSCPRSLFILGPQIDLLHNSSPLPLLVSLLFILTFSVYYPASLFGCPQFNNHMMGSSEPVLYLCKPAPFALLRPWGPRMTQLVFQGTLGLVAHSTWGTRVCGLGIVVLGKWCEGWEWLRLHIALRRRNAGRHMHQQVQQATAPSRTTYGTNWGRARKFGAGLPSVKVVAMERKGGTNALVRSSNFELRNHFEHIRSGSNLR